MKTVLTVAKLRTLKRPGRYRCGASLYLLIAPAGTRSWVQRLVVDGKRRDIGLGGWPTTSLSEARDAAFENRKVARRGGDPTAKVSRVPLFRRAAKRTHEANGGRPAWIKALERYVFPIIGDRRVDRVDQADVLRVLTPIWTTKAATARKVRTAIRQVFSWAQAHGYVAANPAGEAIDGALPAMPAVREHFRAVDYRDVPDALDRIDGSAAGVSTRACLRFIALTAVRSGEARGATWSEIDLDAREWRVPAARMKTGAEHRVPLADAAVTVLDGVRAAFHGPAGPTGTDYVFPSATKPDRPVSYNLTRALQSIGLDCTVHGFRSSFRTWASESTSYPHAVCEMALAHRVGSDVERSYARSDLFDKRRGLMDQWAAYATGDTGKVLHIHAAS